VSVMCDILEVTRGGFYAHAGRPASAREVRRAELVGKVRQAHAESGGLYGSPRVTAELNASEVKVCENTVAKLMQEERIRSKVAARFKPRTTDSNHPNPVADNLLDREFEAKMPNQKWCVDITCIPTNEGTLYLAAVIDLCSRKIVGWSMADHMRTELCLDALNMAILQRRPGKDLLHHSDRGSQYASDDYRGRLATLGITCSMSGRGDCYDNAVMESFWGTYKQESVYQQPNGRFENHGQARVETFKYIELFYNRRRRHSAIGYVSPETFEASLN
jgi:putative transposase